MTLESSVLVTIGVGDRKSVIGTTARSGIMSTLIREGSRLRVSPYTGMLGIVTTGDPRLLTLRNKSALIVVGDTVGRGELLGGSSDGGRSPAVESLDLRRSSV